MWSGPEAATMCSVPPDCGAVELPAAGALLFAELLHAARPAAARTAADSTTKRFGALIMGMFLCPEFGRDQASSRHAPRGKHAPAKATVQWARSRHQGLS